jgi:hypothetical protein
MRQEGATREQQQVPIDGYLNGELTDVSRQLAAHRVEVGAPVDATGPLAVLSQFLTPATVPAGSVVRPVVVGSAVVGFLVETDEVVANLRQLVLGSGNAP